MSVLNEIKSIEFDKNRTKIFGIKSGILWGNRKEGGTFPLVYISKPKHISQEDFEEILDCLDINILRKGAK